MGFSRHYFKEFNFLFTNITGEVNDSDLASHVVAINNETRGLVNVKGFADCRDVTKVNFTTQGTILSATNEENKPGGKIAMLVPENSTLIFAMARAYQMFCEEQFDAVRIFYDFEEALTWLIDDDLHEIKALNDLINKHRKKI